MDMEQVAMHLYMRRLGCTAWTHVRTSFPYLWVYWTHHAEIWFVVVPINYPSLHRSLVADI